jgi:hypothetical protein
MQDSQGVCLLHLTLRAEQRMQAYVGFAGDVICVVEDSGKLMVIN